MSRPAAFSQLLVYHATARAQPLVFRSSFASIRLYATHTETAAARSQAQAQATNDLLKGIRGKSGTGSATQDTVGPFPLGVGPGGRRKTWEKWSQLGLGGKLARTTRQTGNLAVILCGGALFAVLTIALTTELFAKNSPSVLYSQAVDMIRSSDALDAYLLPPIKFTHSPHSSAPVRGTPSIAHTFIRHPTSGREHLVISFWVHGRGMDEKEPLGWIRNAWSSTVAWGKEGIKVLGMVGEEPEGLAKEDVKEELIKEVELNKEGPGMLSRMFGGLSLRSAAGSARGTKTRDLPPAGTYTVGEARGEYVKDESGQFTLLSLIVDIPSSKVTYPGRAVIYHSPEAETEGLLGKRIR